MSCCVATRLLFVPSFLFQVDCPNSGEKQHTQPLGHPTVPTLVVSQPATLVVLTLVVSGLLLLAAMRAGPPSVVDSQQPSLCATKINVLVVGNRVAGQRPIENKILLNIRFNLSPHIRLAIGLDLSPHIILAIKLLDVGFLVKKSSVSVIL